VAIPHPDQERAGSPWPTLGELIDRGERLVVFAEDEGPPPGWYHQAFEEMQDTPYQFPQPEDFTCTLNRGDPDAALFLMNHWVSRQSAAPDRPRWVSTATKSSSSAPAPVSMSGA
jgi:hypothetical protein